MVYYERVHEILALIAYESRKGSDKSVLAEPNLLVHTKQEHRRLLKSKFMNLAPSDSYACMAKE